MKTQGVTKNTFVITASLVIQKILSFLYFWLISNQLTASNLGKYIFALSFTTLFSVFTDLGLSPILTREIAKEKNHAAMYLNSVFGLKILFVMLTVPVILLTLHFSGKNSEIRLLVYLATLIMVLDTFTTSLWSTLRSFQNLFYESISIVIVQIIIFTAGIIFLKTFGTLSFLMVALLIASVFNFIFAAVVVKTKLKIPLIPRWNQELARKLFRIMPAFALGGIFVKLYNTSDSVLLGFLSNEEAVGYYSIPAKVITALTQILPGSFVVVIYPLFARYFLESKEKLTQLFKNSLLYLCVISIPITAGLLALLPETMQLFWPKYMRVVPTFSIMIAALPFLFLTFPTGYLLNACDRQSKNTLNRGIILVGAIILNIILLPRYSYFGAGITFLITQVMVFFLDLFWVRKALTHSYQNIILPIVKIFLASAIMYMVIVAVRGAMPLILDILLGGILYFIVLFVIGGIQWYEIKKIYIALRH